MKLHIEKDIEVPAGFYCNGCWRKHSESNEEKDLQYGCEEFNCFLDQDKNMKPVKCIECLEAYREAVLNK